MAWTCEADTVAEVKCNTQSIVKYTDLPSLASKYLVLMRFEIQTAMKFNPSQAAKTERLLLNKNE